MMRTTAITVERIKAEEKMDIKIKIAVEMSETTFAKLGKIGAIGVTNLTTTDPKMSGRDGKMLNEDGHQCGKLLMMTETCVETLHPWVLVAMAIAVNFHMVKVGRDEAHVACLNKATAIMDKPAVTSMMMVEETMQPMERRSQRRTERLVQLLTIGAFVLIFATPKRAASVMSANIHIVFN